MAGDETVIGGGRFDTGRDGYAEMGTYARQWPNRGWAIEGCQGIGRHIANRLLADGEQVVEALGLFLESKASENGVVS
ncbi:hypothetical protein [Micromonospora sp. MA102]|uniref:hypothetical protein n=1 Tax=Micromonospora sp. MA102 TaxID=2952755 RepID=UPI0021C84FE6|nr:hypothetical protein [Micromonospora sp. MA102]